VVKDVVDNNNPAPDPHEALVTKHLDFLKEIVQEFLNSGEPEEELMQAGYIGLLNAANLYQEQQSETFEQYSRHLICGEIRHYIREKNKKNEIPDWLSVMINKLLNQMLTAYRRQHNTFPDFSELAEMLDLSPEILKEALKARKAVQEVSIDQKRRNNIDFKTSLDIAKIKREIDKKGYGKLRQFTE